MDTGLLQKAGKLKEKRDMQGSLWPPFNCYCTLVSIVTGWGGRHTACASGREISIGLLVGCDLDDSVLWETQPLLGKGECAVESRFGGHCPGSTPVCVSVCMYEHM